MLKCECISNEHNHPYQGQCNRAASFRIRVFVRVAWIEYSVCTVCLKEDDEIVARLRETKRKDS